MFVKKKKKINVWKPELTSYGCGRTWKESQRDGIVRRKCTMCVHEGCILGIYNIWCEIIQIKTDFMKAAIRSLTFICWSFSSSSFVLDYIVNICFISC